MPAWVNGRALGVRSNGAFNSANTDPIPGGRLWPEAAVTWNAMRKAALKSGIQPWEFVPAGGNSSARGRPAQDWFWNHQPPAAARPYTSNHGWGIAVDVKTRRAASYILTHGSKYGWSWDEGQRVGEWWHFRYVGVSRAQLIAIRRAADALKGLSARERIHASRLLWHRRKYRIEARTGKGPKFKKHKRYARAHRDWVEGRIAKLAAAIDQSGDRFNRKRRIRLLKRVVAATRGQL
jgi:hypothetical protein